MGKDVNFDNNSQEFNISLDTGGNLNFLANDKNGAGNRRMTILDSSNEVTFDGRVTVEDGVTVGGSGQFGDLQLKASSGQNTIFLGSSEFEANILVGGSGVRGRVQIFDGDGNDTIDLRADIGLLTVGADGESGSIKVTDSDGHTTIDMNGALGYITVGRVGTVGDDGEAGTIDVCDDDGNVTIRLSGETGVVECDDLDETGVGARAASRPVHNALARVLALQAVSYRTARANGREIPQIGLLGGDVEPVCPELVSTLAGGRKAVNYSRLTALLVEAVKEQQLLIDRQAAELAGLLERIGRIEAGSAV